MSKPLASRGRIAATLTLTLASALVACGDELDQSIPRPTVPREFELLDIVNGPIDRASAFDLVAGRGFSEPVAVRVDESSQWDFAFGVIEGEPVWLPRGFFSGIEPSSGITELLADFEEIEILPSSRDTYELEQPVPVTVDAVYAARSRPDPSISLPCHVFAKLVVDAVEGDPMRVRFRVLWNPNCDDVSVAPGGSS